MQLENNKDLGLFYQFFIRVKKKKMQPWVMAMSNLHGCLLDFLQLKTA